MTCQWINWPLVQSSFNKLTFNHSLSIDPLWSLICFSPKISSRFATGRTCKNLLAPEHGDIEYVIEEYERDDLSILQVRIAENPLINQNLHLLRNFISGRSATGVQVWSGIPFSRRKVPDMFGIRTMGSWETNVWDLWMSTTERVSSTD